MDEKTKYVICYTILGFLTVTGFPYFYLNRFKQGFIFLFTQIMAFSMVINWMYFDRISMFSSLNTQIRVELAWNNLLDGTLVSMPYEWLSPLVFVPAIIQASHIGYLILQKKI